MWTGIFAFTNLLALAAWAILILLPRKPLAMAAVLYCGIGLLCLMYSVLLVLLATGAVDPLRDAGLPPPGLADYSVAGLKSLFRSDGAIVLGWTHYLAFDLFVGLWIARDADAKGFGRVAQAPVLLATFLAGPLGLFAWLTIRERRARAQGRWE
ncbi:abscisic acid-deficient protein Aba4 family protein [Pelagerythrobacter sp.]|uniref:abscisic acid-deficient protein Aba4 family protein n=1 Tax=Pelagerythrobacter sp. TaxID=2800702 RepID=UPI0035AF4B96